MCRVSPSDWRLCATVFCVCVCVFGDSGKTPWSLPIDRRCTAHAQLTLWQQTPVDGCCTCRPVLPVIIVSPRQKSRQLCRFHDPTFGCCPGLSKPKRDYNSIGSTITLTKVRHHFFKIILRSNIRYFWWGVMKKALVHYGVTNVIRQVKGQQLDLYINIGIISAIRDGQEGCSSSTAAAYFISTFFFFHGGMIVFLSVDVEWKRKKKGTNQMLQRFWINRSVYFCLSVYFFLLTNPIGIYRRVATHPFNPVQFNVLGIRIPILFFPRQIVFVVWLA